MNQASHDPKSVRPIRPLRVHISEVRLVPLITLSSNCIIDYALSLMDSNCPQPSFLWSGIQLIFHKKVIVYFGPLKNTSTNFWLVLLKVPLHCSNALEIRTVIFSCFPLTSFCIFFWAWLNVLLYHTITCMLSAWLRLHVLFIAVDLTTFKHEFYAAIYLILEHHYPQLILFIPFVRVRLISLP